VPIATIITPNIPEAEVLTGDRLEANEDLEKACRSLAELGSTSVLIKGGHAAADSSDDCLFIETESGSEIHWLTEKRVESPNTHGTGCTLSSAIAAHLAKGYEIIDAVRSAKKFISEAITAGAEYKIGQGHGPVHHFYGLWQD
jgi:hydroxymethylpyrimidine/phosphomethylpyrimidine kinase